MVGFVIFDPLYEDGKIVGYYADLERYERHPPGIHDLILLEAMKVFKAERKKILSLGLAPLYHLEEEDHPSASALTRDLLKRIYNEVGPVYNFQGVSHHKTYYRPRWEPVYFYSPKSNGASDLLDMFTLVGLCPPEVLRTIRYETFDLVRD